MWAEQLEPMEMQKRAPIFSFFVTVSTSLITWLGVRLWTVIHVFGNRKFDVSLDAHVDLDKNQNEQSNKTSLQLGYFHI